MRIILPEDYRHNPSFGSIILEDLYTSSGRIIILPIGGYLHVLTFLSDLPSTSSNILHCTHTSMHTPSLAALPHLDMPIHCLEDFSPQTSPSGTNYPMVGVLSMYVPTTPIFPISNFWAPVWTCTDPLFCLPGPSWLAHHLVHPSVHLCTPPHTSTHLHTPPHTSTHLCTPSCTLPHTSMHLHAPPCTP